MSIDINQNYSNNKFHILKAHFLFKMRSTVKNNLLQLTQFLFLFFSTINQQLIWILFLARNLIQSINLKLKLKRNLRSVLYYAAYSSKNHFSILNILLWETIYILLYETVYVESGASHFIFKSRYLRVFVNII